jgi:hypothetical protein
MQVDLSHPMKLVMQLQVDSYMLLSNQHYSTKIEHRQHKIRPMNTTLGQFQQHPILTTCLPKNEVNIIATPISK